jgi:hypothetical protein
VTGSTAPATAPVHQPVPLRELDRVPLPRLVRVELRKVTDTRAGRWLLFAIAALTATVAVILFFVGSPTDLTYDTFVGVTGTPQALLLPVLAILAITSEWSQRTGLVTFTLEPSRARVVLAKTLAMTLIGLAGIAAAFAFGGVGNLLAETFQSGSGSWHYPADWVAELTLSQLLAIIEALAFGMLLMSSAAAITLYFVIPIGWSVLFNAVSALQSAAPWVDLGTASEPLGNHTMNAQHWMQLAVATCIWVVLPFALGLYRLLRSEVK